MPRFIHVSIKTFLATACVIGAATAFADYPIVGPQVRIDTGGSSQANETTCSSSDLYPNEVVGAWNDYRSNIRTGVSLSLDGGDSWSDFLLRPPAGYQTSVEGDPMTIVDPRTGYMWAGGIAFDWNGGVFVARKAPGASSFEPAVMTHVSGGADKGWMAVGPVPGNPDSTRVYVAFNEGVQYSTDMGSSWTSPDYLASGVGFLPRVGPDGEAYVLYWDWNSQIRIFRSFNGGASFGSSLHVATRMDVWGIDGTRFPGTFRVPPLAYLAVDPNSGVLYCVYFDTTNVVSGNSNVDLYFTRSFDQGSTWSTPTVINEGTDPRADSFFPWIEVDNQGRLHMVFYDTRNQLVNDSSSHAYIDAYYSYSLDQGDTWTEIRLTDSPFDSEDTGSGGGFIGDYSGLGVGANRVYPCYLSNQDGSSDAFVHTIIWTVTGDIDQDGDVDLADLAELLAAFGACTGDANYNADADFDDSGCVDLSDLAELLANFGFGS